MKKKIGIIVGSNRRDAFSKKVANHLLTLPLDNLELQIVDIAGLQMFNQDFDDDGTTPKEWKVFRNEVRALDGYVFVTPEYNRSYPPLIKNALDIASRPYGQNQWSDKPGAILSVSPGRLSGFGANHHLRQVASFLNIYMMQQPEGYIGEIMNSLDKEGNIIDERLQKMLLNFMKSFEEWTSNFK
ncbi:MAG: NADPH-dependent FMN reductase [Coprobacillaceae bacterium]